jgi:hypothetical protein
MNWIKNLAARAFGVAREQSHAVIAQSNQLTTKNTANILESAIKSGDKQVIASAHKLIDATTDSVKASTEDLNPTSWFARYRRRFLEAPIRTTVATGITVAGTTVVAGGTLVAGAAVVDHVAYDGAGRKAVGNATVEKVTEVGKKIAYEATGGIFGDDGKEDDTNKPAPQNPNDPNAPKGEDGMFGEAIENVIQYFGVETDDEYGNDKPWVQTAKNLIPKLLGLGAAAGTAYFADGKVKWLAVAATVAMAVATGKTLMNEFNPAANPNTTPTHVAGGPQVNFVKLPEPVVTAPNAAPKPQ